jgi:hypothetical protein
MSRPTVNLPPFPPMPLARSPAKIAVPVVSELTEYRTLSNDENGVAVVLEAMLWPERWWPARE